MGRRKKGEPKVEKRPRYVVTTFVGGPKEGEEMRLAWPLKDMDYVFADPEWCIYYKVGEKALSYVGEGHYGPMNEKVRSRK